MKKKYHVVLTPNEPEIIAFKKSLPQGNFSKSVVIIMTESLKDEVAEIPMDFKIEPVIQDVNTKITLPEELVQKFCKKFGCQKGNLTSYIKREVKKCIQNNLDPLPDEFILSTDVKAIFDQVINRVNEKRDSLDASSEKSRLLEKEGLNAFYEMQDTLKQERNKDNGRKNSIY